MNKVYIRVTEALEGDPNVIATLESYGGKNLNKYTAAAGTILFINTFEVIDKWMTSDNAICNLCSHGYQEIFPENVSHTYHLPVPKDNAPSTSIIVPLNVPKGYEAIVGGKPVTELWPWVIISDNPQAVAERAGIGSFQASIPTTGNCNVLIDDGCHSYAQVVDFIREHSDSSRLAYHIFADRHGIIISPKMS